LALPGRYVYLRVAADARTDELISRVAEVNPNTIVVLQAGTAAAMPWVNKVKGIVHAWYLGNQCGTAIASILYGHSNPSGRLSLTLPKREEDIPAFPDFKSARTRVHYSEGIWVGYKHYNMRKIQPLFPFGHGLSYTEFAYSNMSVSAPSNCSAADDWKAVVEVEVKNVGKRTGHHAVQIYLSPPVETEQSLKHPQYTLQGFDKVYDIAPGASKKATINLDKCEHNVLNRADFRCHLPLGRADRFVESGTGSLDCEGRHRCADILGRRDFRDQERHALEGSVIMQDIYCTSGAHNYGATIEASGSEARGMRVR
jgi:hypothetical protein